jgi:hypothetical protein
MVAKSVRQVTTPLSSGTASAPPTPVARRGLVAGLGIAGAAALAVKLVPGAAPTTATSGATPGARPAADAAADGGYRLSAHVKRYYETTQS